MTPLEVRAFRLARLASSGAPYGPDGPSRIVDRVAALPRIEALCREVEGVLLGFPDLRRMHGYGWASDPDSYDLPTDVAFQRRILLMLGKFWVESGARADLADRMADIVVTQRFGLRLDACSPRISASRAPSKARAITIPAGFVEFGTWLFANLRCWITAESGRAGEEFEEDGGWFLVTTATTPRSPAPFDHVGTRELIVRTLAAEGRDENLDATNAAVLIRERVPELAGQGGDLDPGQLPLFDQNAAYMLVEFALAHELGHALASPEAAAADLADRERDADRTGLVLLAMSSATRVFGWGDPTMAPWTQAALGITLFCLFIDCRLILIDGLLRRGIPRAGREGGEREGERVRATGARQTLDRLVQALAGSAESRDDASRVVALRANGDAFARDLRCTVDSLPDAVVDQAISVARASLSEAP